MALSWHSADRAADPNGTYTAAGIMKEVPFEPVGGAINDSIDGAYKAKYKGSEYLSPMIGKRAHSATVKIAPRLMKA